MRRNRRQWYSAMGLGLTEQGVKVLLIDDHRAFNLLLVHSLDLADSGASVSCAESLKDGIEQVQQDIYDVVLLDLSLPDSLGLDTLRQFRKAAPDIPVVVLTGLDDDAVALEAVKIGAQDYLIKSRLNSESLMRALRYAIERKRADRVLHETQRLSELIVDSAMDAVIGVDDGGQIVGWNRSAEKLFGWTREEALGRSLDALIIPRRYRDAKKGGAEQFLSIGETAFLNRVVELTVAHRSGRELPVEMTICMVKRAGDVTFSIFIRDLSEKKLLEKRLASEYEIARVLARSANLSDAAPKLLKVIGEVMDWDIGEAFTVEPNSNNARCLCVWMRSDVDGSRFKQQTMGVIDSIADGFIGAVCESGKSKWFKSIGKEKFLRAEAATAIGMNSYAAFPVTVRNQVVAILGFFSREHRPPNKEVQETLNAIANQIGQFVFAHQAEEVSRNMLLMQQREDFMATLAHDLKTPVAGAERVFGLLLEDTFGALNSEQREIILKLRHNNQALLRMVHNLLDVYKYEAGVYALNLEMVNLKSLVRSCSDEMAPLAASHELQLNVTTNHDALVKGDSVAISRVLINLLSNAIKFTPSGGRIGVTMKIDADSAVVEVEDTGIGIAEEDQERLFQRFWQGPHGRRSSGSGLGLHVSKQIVQAHGGKITCRSVLGEGSTFIIALSLANAHQSEDSPLAGQPSEVEHLETEEIAHKKRAK